MTYHLPECPVPEMDGLWGLPMHPEDAKANCICPSLRACEQRVRQETFDADWSEIGQLAAVRLFRKQAYVAGLDAAREAIVALDLHSHYRITCEPPSKGYVYEDHRNCDGVEDVLAAIDALLGSGNPDTPPSAEKGEKP